MNVRIEDNENDWVRIYENDDLVHDDHPYGRSLDIARQYMNSGHSVELYFGDFDDDGKFVPLYQEEL